MFTKFELIGMGASVFFMASAVYLTQINATFFDSEDFNDDARLASNVNQAAVIVGDQSYADTNETYLAGVDKGNKLNDMVIDDIKIGTGEPVKDGDTVSVHYVGTLQGETDEFDNSRKRGEPIQFKVGAGMVIKGWDEGLVGMKVGGERVLVIPPDKAYGEQGIGPIPPNSTLVFSLELMGIE